MSASLKDSPISSEVITFVAPASKPQVSKVLDRSGKNSSILVFLRRRRFHDKEFDGRYDKVILDGDARLNVEVIGTAPGAYPCGRLPKLPSPFTFTEWQKRICLFGKESLLLAANKTQWQLFEHEGKSQRLAEPDAAVVRAHGVKVASAAMIFGEESQHVPPVSELEFVRLCFEFLEIQDPISNAVPSDEIREMEPVIAKKDYLKPLRSKTRNELGSLRAYLFTARLQESQWRGKYRLKQHWSLAPYLFEQTIEIFRNKHIKNEGAKWVTDFLETRLGTRLDVFIRSIFGIYSIAASRLDPKIPGIIRIGNIEEEAARKWDLRLEDVRLAAQKFAVKPNECYSIRDAVSSIPEIKKKYSDAVELFTKSPLIDFSAGTEGPHELGRHLMPSPFAFFESVRRFMLWELISDLSSEIPARFPKESKEGTPKQQDPYNMRGEAFEDLIIKIIEESGIPSLPIKGGRKRAEVLTKGTRTLLAIEAKFALKPNKDFQYRDASSLMYALSNLREALDQCSETLGDQNGVALICVFDELSSEATALLPILKRFNLVPNNIEAVAIIDPLHLADQLSCGAVDYLIENIRELWRWIMPGSTENESRLELAPNQPTNPSKLLNEIQNKYFPGLDLS